VNIQNVLRNKTESIAPKIVRQKHLAEKIVIVDGLPGCGKTLFSPIVAALDRVELLNYAFEIEFLCRLFYLNKIEEDAAIAMVRMLTDHKLYQTMMGRETNFRYSDLSSVFKDANPWRYFKRIFREGDMAIPERIKKERPILNLTTHDLLSVSKPVFTGLAERLVFIEVIRHPLYMIIQQSLNMERLLDNPRDIQIYVEYKSHQLPYFAHGWEELFFSSNSIEKTIYTIERMTHLTNDLKESLSDKYLSRIITIPFENFVLDPQPYMKRIEDLLKTNITSKTRKVIKKQNVPRCKISDGIPLAIYKRCGWQPPEKGLSEKQELEKRRQYAIAQGAGKDAMLVLDEICAEYERKCTGNIF
jgi:hypothetical protein